MCFLLRQQMERAIVNEAEERPFFATFAVKLQVSGTGNSS